MQILFELKIEKIKRFLIFNSQKKGWSFFSTFLTPHPTPPTHPPHPLPQKLQKVGFKLGGSGRVRTKGLLGNVFVLAQVAPNIVPKATSVPFPFLAALLQDLTLAVATSIPGVGVVSDGGIEDTTGAKAAATGSLPSRRLTFACVKPGASAVALGQAPSIYISVIFSAPPVTASSPRDQYQRVHHL